MFYVNIYNPIGWGYHTGSHNSIPASCFHRIYRRRDNLHQLHQLFLMVRTMHSEIGYFPSSESDHSDNDCDISVNERHGRAAVNGSTQQDAVWRARDNFVRRHRFTGTPSLKANLEHERSPLEVFHEFLTV